MHFPGLKFGVFELPWIIFTAGFFCLTVRANATYLLSLEFSLTARGKGLFRFISQLHLLILFYAPCCKLCVQLLRLKPGSKAVMTAISGQNDFVLNRLNFCFVEAFVNVNDVLVE